MFSRHGSGIHGTVEKRPGRRAHTAQRSHCGAVFITLLEVGAAAAADEQGVTGEQQTRATASCLLWRQVERQAASRVAGRRQARQRAGAKCQLVAVRKQHVGGSAGRCGNCAVNARPQRLHRGRASSSSVSACARMAEAGTQRHAPPAHTLILPVPVIWSAWQCVFTAKMRVRPSSSTRSRSRSTCQPEREGACARACVHVRGR